MALHEPTICRASRSRGRSPAHHVVGADLLARGRLREARVRLWEEWRVADGADDREAAAEAALALGGIWVHEHRATLERARVLSVQRRAGAGLDPASSLALRLRVRVAAEEAYAEGTGDALVSELDRARQAGDPLALAEALSLTHHCLLGPGDAAERLALADELIGVAPATGRSLDATMGLAWRTVDLVLAGDRRARRSLRELRQRLAEQPCDAVGFLADGLEVTEAMRRGELGRAEELAARCVRTGHDVGDADADGWYAAQLVAIRWMQGRAGELVAAMEELEGASSVPELNEAFTAAVAVVAADAGATDLARRALGRLRAPGLARITPSSAWLVTLAGACHAAHALGDGPAAAEAYPLLAPHADLPVMASLGIACFGSAHRPLALAAAAMGDLDRAVDHLDAAVQADLALGNRPTRAIALGTLAQVLAVRGRPGDAERSAAARREAVAEAGRCGMEAWARRWEAPAAPQPVTVTCRREGRSWQIGAGEAVAVVPHCVGLVYLAQLVANPDRSIAAVELVSGHALAGGGRPDPVVDGEAKARYRRRIEDLRAEIDDAELRADPERAALARLELDHLVEELARAAGWNGHERTFVDDTERARVSVRKAISRALGAIADADPDVAREIEARLTTGARCTFHTAAPG